MLVLDCASSKDAGMSAAHAPMTRPMSTPRSIAKMYGMSVGWLSSVTRLATMLRNALTGAVQFVLVEPVRRHMERKLALHALIGLTNSPLGSRDPRQAERAEPESDAVSRRSGIGEVRVAELPTARTHHRPRRRTAYGVNAITVRAAAGMRRVRSVEPFARAFDIANFGEPQPCI